MILLAQLMVALYFLIFFTSSIQAANVALIVGNSTGYRGSHYNAVEVILDNPDVRVRGIQMDICDVGDYLYCTACKTMDRTFGFTYKIEELANGCCGVILLSFSDNFIEEGTGPIFTLRYDVSEEASSGQCINLNPKDVKVADEFSNPLDVVSVPGEFCYNNCTTPDDCDVGLWCYYNQTCFTGVCQSTERCPDDGAFCNGLEYCDEDNDECKITSEPCAYCYSYSCACDEDEDLCVGCNADNDCDGICNPEESDPHCYGLDNCPDVSNFEQYDLDGDRIGDVCDNCPYDYNPYQKDKNADGIGDVCDPETIPCIAEELYGEHSEEAELLRHFRDNVLSQTPVGQEIIKLYYQWSPVIVKAMEEDEEFKEEAKEMIDGILTLIESRIE